MSKQALPDVHKDWANLKNRPIINKNQPFDWMNHLTDKELEDWRSKIQGDVMAAMVDTHVLYEVSKLSKDK